MTRRMIALAAAGIAIAAGGIALAILTRDGDAPLKQAARASTTSTSTATSSTASRSTQPALEHSTAIASGADPAIASRDPSVADVAGLGNGSAGEELARLADELAQHHWANAMAQCLSPEIAIAGAKSCAISACELHDFTHARAFYSHVSAEDRPEVKLECEQAHVQLERPRPGRFPHRPFGRSPAAPSTGSNG